MPNRQPDPVLLTHPRPFHRDLAQPAGLTRPTMLKLYAGPPPQPDLPFPAHLLAYFIGMEHG